MYSYQEKDAKTAVYSNSFTFNDKSNKLTSMPALKISGSMYLPAEEALSKIIGLNYNYNADTQTLEVENKVTGKKVKLALNEPSMSVNGQTVSLSTPMYLVTRKDTKSEVLCIPSKKVLTALGYSYKWDNKKTLI